MVLIQVYIVESRCILKTIIGYFVFYLWYDTIRYIYVRTKADEMASLV